ncbi:MAG: hypothetical protein PHY29_11720 [Syntrophales bacterium]|nr:hypothetical protein [Syntrophales bacterium]
MSKRPRRNHAPAFKTKVVLDAMKGEQTLVELSQTNASAYDRINHCSSQDQ